MNVPIISVTGTKGKTTTVSVIAHVLQTLGKNVLKVDTTGHFINGERKSTLEDSKNTWRLVPSVAPGRYLWEFYANPALQENGVAVLECSLGSSANSGLAYRYHNVGVFLNVFEDHLGSSDRIQTREDIAEAKKFVFTRLAPEGGYAVFNADDQLVCTKLDEIKHVQSEKVLVPFGLTFSQFDIEAHLNDGGIAVTVNGDKQIVLRSKDSEEIVADLKLIPWTFNSVYEPSVWNLLSAVGALYGYYEGHLPVGFRAAIEATRLDRTGGRLTLFKARNGATIIADYAHEKTSLQLIGKLAKTLTKDGKVIGVVRLAHDRTDGLMIDTGHAIAGSFDTFIVYDKIDGHFRKPKTSGVGMRFPQIVGRTSEILADAIRTENPSVERIIREDEAISRAAAITDPNDIVVVIVNDDIEQSIQLIKDSFNAEFV